MRCFFFISFVLSCTVLATNGWEDVYDVYQREKDELKDGTTRFGKILFIQFSNQLEQNTAKERRKAEGRAMLEVQAQLKGYIEREHNQKNRRFIFFKRKGVETIVKVTESKVLFNGIVSGNLYRYCLAVPLE